MNQISYVLPKSAWENIVIKETNEPLVVVEGKDGIILGNKFSAWKEECSYLVRKSVAQMLYEVSKHLPSGYKIALIEGVRPLNKQRKHWDAKIKEIITLNPQLSEEEVKRNARMVIAEPSILANHNCGGAIDVSLVTDNHELVDMGTLPQELLGKDIVEMFSEKITDQQKHNRSILREAMEKVGFVWYPGEWWHYCYGDRMWAVYTNRNECMYGSIEKE